MISIVEFNQGDRFRLIDFGETALVFRRKLLSLGLIKGAEIKVIRVAPLGCPIQVELRGSSFALRKHEAKHLLWEKI